MIFQWQDLDTQGASDAEFISLPGNRYLLIVANNQNNLGQSNIASAVYTWNNVGVQFSLLQLFQTFGAKAVRSLFIGSSVFVAIANNFDSTTQASKLR